LLSWTIADARRVAPRAEFLTLYVGLAADDDFHATSEIAAESIMEICPKAGAGRAITDRGGHPAKSGVTYCQTKSTKS
jgi:hypothetical protein